MPKKAPSGQQPTRKSARVQAKTLPADAEGSSHQTADQDSDQSDQDQFEEAASNQDQEDESDEDSDQDSRDSQDHESGEDQDDEEVSNDEASSQDQQDQALVGDDEAAAEQVLEEASAAKRVRFPDLDPDTPLRSIEPNDRDSTTPCPPEMSNQQTVEQLQARIAELEAQRDGGDRERREATPFDSAFGGNKFKPTGIAAWESFKPFGKDQHARNAKYNEKAKTRSQDPGQFEGDQQELVPFMTKFADRCDIDGETYRTERARMADFFSHLKGKPADLVADRYQKRQEEGAFLCLAEMIQVVASTYQDHNQAAKARAALATLQYDPYKDVYSEWFSDVSKNLSRAGIPYSQWKVEVYDRVDPDLGYTLQEDSLDPNISFETFSRKLKNAADAQQKSILRKRQRRETRQETKRASSPKNQPRPSRDSKPSYKGPPHKKDKKAAVTSNEVGRALTKAEKRVHWDNETCFNCGQTGHKSKDPQCPKNVRAVKVDDEASDESDEDSGKD